MNNSNGHEKGFVIGEDWSGQYTIFAPAGTNFFYGALAYKRAGDAGATTRLFSKKEDMEQFIDFLDLDEVDNLEYDYE